MELVAESSGGVGQQHVHAAYHAADHADLRKVEADGFLKEDVEGSERPGHGPASRAKEKIPVITLTVALHKKGLKLRPEAGLTIDQWWRRWVFALLYLEAHHSHADRIDHGRANEDFLHVRLRMRVDVDIEKNALDARHDAEEP